MDGLIELLIIAAIFLLPALEAWTKRRRKEQRRREDGGEAEAPRDARWPGRGGEAGRGDESAEVLLPEDLWEELTGQRRRADAEAGTGGAAEVEEAGVEDWEHGGAGSAEAGPMEAPHPEPSPAPWRETDRAEAGPGAADLGGRMGSGEFGRAAGAGGPATGEAAGSYGMEEPRRADAIREGRGRPARSPAHRSRIAEIGGLRPGRAARRGAGAAGDSDRHPLVGDLDRQALRRAVVWAEILAPPVSMRER